MQDRSVGVFVPSKVMTKEATKCHRGVLCKYTEGHMHIFSYKGVVSSTILPQQVLRMVLDIHLFFRCLH